MTMYKCAISYGQIVTDSVLKELEEFIGAHIGNKDTTFGTENSQLVDFGEYNIDLEIFYNKFPNIKLEVKGISSKVPVYSVYEKGSNDCIVQTGYTYKTLKECLDKIGDNLNIDLEDKEMTNTSLYGILIDYIYEGQFEKIMDWKGFWNYFINTKVN